MQERERNMLRNISLHKSYFTAVLIVELALRVLLHPVVILKVMRSNEIDCIIEPLSLIRVQLA